MSAYIIREATPEDAAAILVHNDLIANEPDNGITRGPGENMTLQEEVAYLETCRATDNWVMLIAITPMGEVIGICGFQGGRRRATRHDGDFGISVNREWRDKGVGSALIQHLIAWAKSTGIITRVGLTVMTHNERAIHVYKKLGFELEGCKRAALFKEGRYIDVYMMGLLLLDRPKA
ncbi:MAG: GNAT family N-acetyltransferase [Chloroflexi bacterium]|nr:GNAT family N-acetyltransferase [Chloroflexota bacterium]MCC6893346.1 GNAT family N-acetyltransferase [Anaerolineae bacterium]